MKLRYHRPKVSLLSIEDDDQDNAAAGGGGGSSNQGSQGDDFTVYSIGVIIDCGIVFCLFLGWILSYVTSDKQAIDIIKDGS